MKFLNLTLSYENTVRTINLEDKTLIYSRENSIGKSTLLRLLFYSIGYPIPGTYGLKFSKINCITTFQRENITYTVHRKDNYVEIYKKDVFLFSKNLTNDDDDWFTYIWGIDSIHVLKNLLGAIYMDQDKGWTLLNRGKVIGNIRFNIRDLLIGLSKNEHILDEKIIESDNQKKMLQATKQLINIKETSYSSYLNDDEQHNSDTELQAKYNNLKIKRNVAKNQLKSLKQNIDDVNGLKKFIMSLNLMVQIDQNPVVVNDENLLNFDDNVEFLKQRSAKVQLTIDDLNHQILNIKESLRKSTISLFQENDIIKKTLQDVANMDIDISVLESREQELKRSILSINSEIEEIFMNNNELIDETREWIIKFATKLGVEGIVKSKEYLFTRDLKSISGTIYYKIVFSFKMAYIKIIEKYTGLSLPIVLDSPSGREVTDRNITEVIEILNSDFKNNQVIIASINKYPLNNVNEIVLTHKLFE